MKINYLTFILLLNCIVALSQNLVVNPSFELHEECPETFTAKYKKNLQLGWTSPTSGTPDYFNKCSEDLAGIPENWAGFCEPSDGNAYMGIYLYREPNYREFIQGTFMKPLILGKSYRFTFYISHSLNSEYFTKSVGCLLSNSQVSNYFENEYSYSVSELKKHKKGESTMDEQQNTPFDPLNIKTDEGQYFQFQLEPNLEEWQLIDFNFMAQNQFTNFVIGNFEELRNICSMTNESRYKFEVLLDRSSYVLIDNFSLTRSDVFTSDSLKLPTSFIIGDMNFEFSSATLTVSARHLLDSLHQHFLYSNNINILILGHTDNIGDDFCNDQLSLLRAENVSNYLTSIGLSPNRATVLGKGESEPIRENDSKENRSLNRRVEIQFLKH